MKKIGSDGKEQRGGNFYKAPYVTPAQFAALTPLDTDECYLVADATNGVIWHFRYNAGSASAYKWEYLGGAPMVSEIITSEGRATAGYSDISTVGPSLTTPRGGDYDIVQATQQTTGGSSTDMAGNTSLSIGGVTAVVADQTSHAIARSSVGYFDDMVERTIRKAGLAASAVVKIQYSVSAAPGVAFANRRLSLLPVRIS